MAFDYKSFRTLCMASQEELLSYFGEEFKTLYGKEKVIANNDFVFCKGDIEIMLVAHLDTVHKKQVEYYFVDSVKGVITSPQGIGGDDRCGVYAILKIIGKMSPRRPHILFTTDEECGMRGAIAAAKELKPYVENLKFIIEIDRKGEDDCVFYSCGNESFKTYIQTFGFKLAYGSCSDIGKLAPAWDVAAVNLSSGYYNAHSKDEYVVVAHLEKTIQRVVNILNDNSEKSKKYDYGKVEYSYGSNWVSKNNRYGYFDDEVTQYVNASGVSWYKERMSWGYYNDKKEFVPTDYRGKISDNRDSAFYSEGT